MTAAQAARAFDHASSHTRIQHHQSEILVTGSLQDDHDPHPRLAHKWISNPQLLTSDVSRSCKGCLQFSLATEWLPSANGEIKLDCADAYRCSCVCGVHSTWFREEELLQTFRMRLRVSPLSSRGKRLK